LSKPSSAERGDPVPKVAEAFSQLRSLLAEANQLAEVLERIGPRLGGGAATDPSEVAAPAGGGDAARVKELERRLEAAQDDQEELTAQLVEAENLAGKLMSLYVATYQLHVSLDPVEVQNAIAEIAKDLLGASSFVLLIKDEVEGGCEVALATGIPPESRFTGNHYHGGDGMVDATLEDGVLRMESERATEALAAVPLRVEDAIVGAIVILKVVDHKVTPLSEDRDILDLLAAHAASALFAARVYSKTDRKLRTLQSLVDLIRGA
jgi:GAF domain-containing protein